MLNIQWKKLDENAYIPTKATPVASGYDFRAPHDFTLHAGERKLIPTFIALQMTINLYGLDDVFIPDMVLEGCSGNANKKGIAVLGGVIDNDYQNGVGAILLNTSDKDIFFAKGDKLCQGLIGLRFRSSATTETIVDEFSNITERGLKGFGEMTGIAGEGKF